MASMIRTIERSKSRRKTAVAYARYSSANQREESIDAQLRAIREYCERENIELIAEFTDEAISISSGSSTGYLFLRSLAPAAPNDSLDLKLINELKENRETYFEYLKQVKEKKATESVKKEEPKQETDLLGGDFSTEIGEFDADLDGFFL
jgi:predicted site-specific integrase-resolvase